MTEPTRPDPQITEEQAAPIGSPDDMPAEMAAEYLTSIIADAVRVGVGMGGPEGAGVAVSTADDARVEMTRLVGFWSLPNARFDDVDYSAELASLEGLQAMRPNFARALADLTGELQVGDVLHVSPRVAMSWSQEATVPADSLDTPLVAFIALGEGLDGVEMESTEQRDWSCLRVVLNVGVMRPMPEGL